MQNTPNQPKWWSNTHDSAWERTKAALKRDWEQTKNDITGGGHDLNQDATETLRQARGVQPIPTGNIPNPPDAADIERHAKQAEKERKKEVREWERSESAVRYGFGAGLNRDRDWNATEVDLRDEWGTLYSDRPWDDSREDIRYGWENARKSTFLG